MEVVSSLLSSSSSLSKAASTLSLLCTFDFLFLFSSIVSGECLVENSFCLAFGSLVLIGSVAGCMGPLLIDFEY